MDSSGLCCHSFAAGMSLQQNYQGNDDIESMIEDRLKKLNK